MASKTSEQQLQCPYKWADPPCYKRFKSKKDLQAHKIARDDHEYCEKCDLDFQTWEAHVEHRAASNENIHITCRFCGMDFGSISGRERHIRQMHPLDQQVQCNSCGKRFTRGAGLIHHLEAGLCKVVTSSRFHSLRRHKQNVSELLVDSNATLDKTSRLASYIEGAQDDDSGGGVALNLLDDQMSSGCSVQVLEPERSTLTKSKSATSPGQDDFPALSTSVASAMETTRQSEGPLLGLRMSRSKVKKNTSISDDMKKLSMRSGLSTPPQSGNAASKDHNDARVPTQNTSASVWNKDKPSARKLFSAQNSTPAPPRELWDIRINTQKSEEQSTNLLTFGALNPQSSKWDPERFQNKLTDEYECPFPQCEFATSAELDIGRHLETDHPVGEPHCPSCKRDFASVAKLVSHCESSNTCLITKSKGFKQWLDLITGGFLSADTKLRSDLEFHTDIETFEGTQKDRKPSMAYTAYESRLPEPEGPGAVPKKTVIVGHGMVEQVHSRR